MTHYPPKLMALMRRFSRIERSERIELLICLASRFREVPATVARRPFPENRRVPDCESDVYVWSRVQPDGTLKYFFAVENPQGISAKATTVILDQALSGTPLEEVVQVPLDVIYRFFGYELSMGKGLGLTGILRLMQSDARRQLAHQKSGQFN